MANLRISLGVEVRPGNEHAGAQGLPGLWQTLEKLPRHQWPTFIRGDCGYGQEGILRDSEERLFPYLLILRHTAKVKVLVQRMMREGALWQALESRPAPERLEPGAARHPRARSTQPRACRRGWPGV